MSEEVLNGLKKYFNFDNFKSDTQKKAIESVLKGKKDRKSIKKIILMAAAIYFRTKQCLHLHAYGIWKIALLPPSRRLARE